MKTLQKRIAACMAAVIVFAAAYFSPLSVGAAAAEPDVKFDDTDVLEDLQSIEGFDIRNYQYYSSPEPEMHVINVVEYCYSFYDNLRDNYGLYLYVYNPNALYIDTDNYGNCVQIAVKYDTEPVTEKSEPVDYEKFGLELCSVSSAPDTARLFYKFKVIDHTGKDGKTIAERVNSNARRYDISGIELVRKGHRNADEYPLTGKYSLDGEWNAYGSFIFTGFAKGYGPDENAESTLSCKISKLETVQLGVKHTFYRTESSSMGYGYQNQIDTVYFSVPKRLFDDYGTLQRIKAEWYEYKTKPILVTSNKEYYDWISKYIGVCADRVPDDRYFVTEPFDSYPEDLVASWWFLLCGGIVPAIVWETPKGHRPTDYAVNAWNVKEGWESTFQVDPLNYIFATKNWCDIGEYDPYAEIVENGGVGSNDLYEYIKRYKKTADKGYLPIKNGKISADLFEDDIDEDRKMDNERGKIQKGHSYYNFDASLDLQSWLSYSDTEHSYWETFKNFGFWAALFGSDEIPTDKGNVISPIQVVTPNSPELKLEGPQLSDKLFINYNDVKEFRDTCTDAFTVDGKNDEEKYVVMFRFAVTDYYSEGVWLAEWVDNGWDNYEKGQAYLAGETVFFDFNVIQLSFLKGEDWKVIAAVSNPIDIVNDITPPTHLSDKERDIVDILLAVLGLIAVGVALYFIITRIFIKKEDK